jgi:circadian clock protein KaiB
MSKPARFKFRLYVAGDGPNSRKAIANLAAICREHLPGRHEIEIVDVFCEPKRALKDGVLLTPLVVRIQPRPTCQIVGSLTEREPVLQAMGLDL